MIDLRQTYRHLACAWTDNELADHYTAANRRGEQLFSERLECAPIVRESTAPLRVGCSSAARSGRSSARDRAASSVCACSRGGEQHSAGNICDECVALCVALLEQEIGESWREEAEQRLGGENHEDE